MMIKRTMLFIIIMLFINGCMGREGIPISRYLPGDENRSCRALKTEISQNEALIKEKLQKDKNKFWSNAAWIVITPLPMDTKEAEKVEAEALQQRNNTLRIIMEEKNCIER